MHLVSSSIKQQAKPRHDLSDLPARVRDVAILRGFGYSYREIGQRFGMTPQAASVMLTRHRRSLSSLRNHLELAGLSARATNVLGRIGVSSREGASSRDIAALLENQRNCGAKTRAEIARWLSEGDASQSGGSPAIGHFDGSDSFAAESHPVEAQDAGAGVAFPDDAAVVGH